MGKVADEFETERLVVRRVGADDLVTLLDVHTSNPGYLDLTEGSLGEPGRYDLEMLQRDFAIARMTPGRHLAGLFLKQSDELVGLLDWMEENPLDGKPWLGLLMIRADQQRQGYAVEAFEGLAQRLRTHGASVVRAGVVVRNPAGRLLTRRLGFEAVSTTVTRMTSEEEVVVLERAL